MKNKPARKRLKKEMPAGEGRKTVVASVSLDPIVSDALREHSEEIRTSVSQVVDTVCRLHLVENDWDGDCWDYANVIWRKIVSRALGKTDAKVAEDPESCGEPVSIFLPDQQLAIISSIAPPSTHSLRDLVGVGAILSLNQIQLAIVTPSPRLLPVSWRTIFDQSGVLTFDVDNVLSYLANRDVIIKNGS